MSKELAGLALEEIKILEEIIGRHESHALKVKGWMFFVMIAFIAAIFTGNLSLPPSTLLLGSLLAVACFHLWASHHYVIAERAIVRCKTIEQAIFALYAKDCGDDQGSRTACQQYQGFKVTDSLNSSGSLMEIGPQLKKPWNLWSLVVAIIIVLAATVSHSERLKVHKAAKMSEQAHKILDPFSISPRPDNLDRK